MSALDPFYAFYQGLPVSLPVEAWAAEFHSAERLLLDPQAQSNKIWRANKYYTTSETPNKISNNARNLRFFSDPSWQTLTHSFVAINNQVYALLPHGDQQMKQEHIGQYTHLWEENPAFAGAGAEYIVKYAIDKHHRRFVIKKPTRSNTFDQTTASINISDDLNVYLGKSDRYVDEKRRVYLLEPYLGENLNFLLSHYQFSFSDRFDMSIQLLWRTQQLHQGKLSKTGTAYAHRDLKPDNVVYDFQKRRINFVDFSQAITNLNYDSAQYLGTRGFRPKNPHRATTVAHDLLSCKRIIAYCKDIADFEGYFENRKESKMSYPNLLSQQELSCLGQLSLFDTNDEVGVFSKFENRWVSENRPHLQLDIKMKASAAFYAANLVLGNYGASVEQSLLLNRPSLCSAVVFLYFSNLASQHTLERLVHFPEITRKLAVLSDFSESLPQDLLISIGKDVLEGRNNETANVLIEKGAEENGETFWVNDTIDALCSITDLSDIKRVLSQKTLFARILQLQKNNELDGLSLTRTIREFENVVTDQPTEHNPLLNNKNRFFNSTSNLQEEERLTDYFFAPVAFIKHCLGY